VIQFLRYDPNPAPGSFEQALTSLQWRHGLPRELLAVRLGIERKTLFNWLAGTVQPGSKTVKKILSSKLPGADILAPFL
jgi:hypothetical protein